MPCGLLRSVLGTLRIDVLGARHTLLWVTGFLTVWVRIWGFHDFVGKWQICQNPTNPPGTLPRFLGLILGENEGFLYAKY